QRSHWCSGSHPRRMGQRSLGSHSALFHCWWRSRRLLLCRAEGTAFNPSPDFLRYNLRTGTLRVHVSRRHPTLRRPEEPAGGLFLDNLRRRNLRSYRSRRNPHSPDGATLNTCQAPERSAHSISDRFQGVYWPNVFGIVLPSNLLSWI